MLFQYLVQVNASMRPLASALMKVYLLIMDKLAETRPSLEAAPIDWWL